MKSICICLLILTLYGCGKFIYSPYVSKVDSKNYNAVNLKSIQERESLYGNTFKVAVISDSHDYYYDLNRQISYINNNTDEIAFVIHTGDATNLGMLLEWNSFLDELTKLSIPFLMAIGNHDMLTYGIDLYRQLFGSELDFTFNFKQTQFVLYNNNNWESSGHAPDMDFLNSTLSASTSTHHLLFAHVQADDTDRYTNDEISTMKDLVNLYNVDYLVNGHNHNHGEGTFGNAKRLTAGSAVKGKILILTISDSGVSHEFITF